MKISERIEEDFKKALKSKDETSVSTLRLLKAALKNKEIELKKELTDDELLDLLSKEIKKRKESEEIYRQAERRELADKEGKEIEILQRYLPEQISEEELEKIIKDEISKTGASSLSDLGKVMTQVMPKVKGRVDGSAVSKKVAELLK